MCSISDLLTRQPTTTIQLSQAYQNYGMKHICWECLRPWTNHCGPFQDSGGNNLTCANNCRGVDPNSVIIGGTALLAAASVGRLGRVFLDGRCDSSKIYSRCVNCSNVKVRGNMLEKPVTRDVQDGIFCFLAGWVGTNFVGKGGAGDYWESSTANFLPRSPPCPWTLFSRCMLQMSSLFCFHYYRKAAKFLPLGWFS